MPEFYQRWISPLVHSVSGVWGACRFQPTCSEYAVAAVAHHGLFAGSGLALWRLMRCNPFCRGGLDPIPGWRRPAAEAVDSPSSLRTDDPLHLP